MIIYICICVCFIGYRYRPLGAERYRYRYQLKKRSYRASLIDPTSWFFYIEKRNQGQGSQISLRSLKSTCSAPVIFLNQSQCSLRCP